MSESAKANIDRQSKRDKPVIIGYYKKMEQARRSIDTAITKLQQLDAVAPGPRVGDTTEMLVMRSVRDMLNIPEGYPWPRRSGRPWAHWTYLKGELKRLRVLALDCTEIGMPLGFRPDDE